jgi:D-alanyl-D-alanine-carboxypeptidase/D-alanyl-D-alanine-endopeptidase
MRELKAACIGAAVLALSIGSAVRTFADDLALRDAASMAGIAMFLSSGAPGLIISVVHGEDSYIEGYGETAPGNKVEPNGKSIIRLGSVSKVFATDLLAAMAAEGRVGLTDPLSRYARRACRSNRSALNPSPCWTSRPIRLGCRVNFAIPR